MSEEQERRNASKEQRRVDGKASCSSFLHPGDFYTLHRSTVLLQVRGRARRAGALSN
jgi:hypothetical protein